MLVAGRPNLKSQFVTSSLEFLPGQLEHEITREARAIALDGLDKRPAREALRRRPVALQSRNLCIGLTRRLSVDCQVPPTMKRGLQPEIPGNFDADAEVASVGPKALLVCNHDGLDKIGCRGHHEETKALSEESP